MKRDRTRKRLPGFTIIELVAVLAILSILAAVAVPVADLAMRRQKERELRTALWQIRDAIDAYKRSGDEGRIARSPGASGYPPSLQVLADGAIDLKSRGGSSRIFFLRRIPRDPLHADRTTPPEQTWGLRSFESPADAPKPGADVYDVYSRAEGLGLDGTAYRRW